MGNPQHPGSLLNKHNRWGHHQHTTHTARLDQTMLDCFFFQMFWRCFEYSVSVRFTLPSANLTSNTSVCLLHTDSLSQLNFSFSLSLLPLLFQSVSPCSCWFKGRAKIVFRTFSFSCCHDHSIFPHPMVPLPTASPFKSYLFLGGKNAPFSLFSRWKGCYFVRNPFLLWF